MKIEDIKVGMSVLLRENFTGYEWEVFQVEEIHTNGSLVIGNDEGGCDGVLPAELNPLPEMPDEVVRDIPGFIRQTIDSKTGKVIDRNFHAAADDDAGEGDKYCYIKEDTLTYDEPELTEEQIAVVKSRMKEE